MHIPLFPRPPVTAGAGSETARRMLDAALLFLGALTSEQKNKALYSLSSEERLNWHYIPRPRQGLSFKEMDGSQQKFAHALISSGLSREGYAKAMTILGLEAILKEIERPAWRFVRDPDLYYLTFFGTPSIESPWGWRVEGHHLSLNFLIVGGSQIAPAPNFFGSNPAEVPEGYRLAGLRVLAREEDLARQLLLSMNKDQRPRTMIASEAPGDIVTRAAKRIQMDNPVGVAVSEMEAEQKRILFNLVAEYLYRMPEDVACARMNQIEKEGSSHIHFGWAGSEKHGAAHYYRLHGPSFLVEYDNTQNNANHIHTVWRDLKNDWGEDLLQHHYMESHKGRG
jgi:hypothetical protein